jgi:hypothetical protein
MSAHLFSVVAQSDTGSEWNWLLIFILAVVVLAIALIAQARFSAQEAEEIAEGLQHEEAHHDDGGPHEEDAEAGAASDETEVEPETGEQIEPEPEAGAEPEEVPPSEESEE